jgi:RNA polymerase sigma-70 factor, ECF subfamily
MATTSMQVSSERLPRDCCSSKVQQLTELIADDLARFHRVARARLDNAADAEDAVQDAVLSALKHVNQFRGQAKMSTWLTSIVINSARMTLRRRSVPVYSTLDKHVGQEDFTLAETIADKGPGPEETYCKREMAEILARSTHRLSPNLYKTFQLRQVEGLSIQETAKVLRVPAGTVKARTTRAHRKLRVLLQGVLRSRTQSHKNLSPRISIDRE